MDNREPEEISSAAVRTLAESYYECGFPPDHAEAMAWALARLPENEEF